MTNARKINISRGLDPIQIYRSRSWNFNLELFQLTFVDDVKSEDGCSGGSAHVSSSLDGKSSTHSGPGGRQLVPGLLYIDDKTANINGKVNGGEGKSKLDPTSNPFIPGVEYNELKALKEKNN